jgi:uncharacterized protein YlxP (DUF503 family)
MYVATAHVTIHLFASDSLKDKRQVLRSVLARARNQFEVSAAEVGSNDLWNQAEVGLAYVSSSGSHADEVIQHAIRAMESSRPDIELTQIETEILTID